MDKSVQTEINELKLEITREAKKSLVTALKTGDSAMVAAIAEILKLF